MVVTFGSCFHCRLPPVSRALLIPKGRRSLFYLAVATGITAPSSRFVSVRVGCINSVTRSDERMTKAFALSKACAQCSVDDIEIVVRGWIRS